MLFSTVLILNKKICTHIQKYDFFFQTKVIKSYRFDFIKSGMPVMPAIPFGRATDISAPVSGSGPRAEQRRY